LHSRTQSPCFESGFYYFESGFSKVKSGFFKHESGFVSSWGPGFSRVWIFLESEFRSMPCVRDKGRLLYCFILAHLFLQVLTELCMVDNADNLDFWMSDVSNSQTSQFGTLQIGPTKYCPERPGARENTRGYT
jgi:hypothetical protein